MARMTKPVPPMGKRPMVQTGGGMPKPTKPGMTKPVPPAGKKPQVPGMVQAMREKLNKSKSQSY